MDCFKIESRSDINDGVVLTVVIPTDQIDKTALMTLENDTPDFIVPFRTRNIDGELEITYVINDRSRLKYFSGHKSLTEYSQLFTSLLTPFVECADWFLVPDGFVMDPEYVFYEPKTGTVSYIYIPSKTPSSYDGELKAMVKRFNDEFQVDNIALGYEVLKIITDNFRINDILQVIRRAADSAKPVPRNEELPGQSQLNGPEEKEAEKAADKIKKAPQEPGPAPVPVPAAKAEPVHNEVRERRSGDNNGDIFIDMSSQGKDQRDNKDKKAKKNKKQVPDEKPRKRLFGFGGKSKVQKDEEEQQPNRIISGAAEEPAIITPKPQQSIRKEPVFEINEEPEQESEVTYIEEAEESAGAHLSYIGSSQLPKLISIEIQEGGQFRIGRFDASVGRKQSDFEFDARTKAVSRHHAVIELKNGIYTITDVGSSAGTFVNGIKLIRNSRAELENGTKVSFGNAGADYIFSE